MAGEFSIRKSSTARAREQKILSEVEQMHKTQATLFQEQVADYITRNIGYSSRLNGNPTRTADSTGRLARVTRQVGNRYVGKTTWSVGIPVYLDRSAAKYWRTVEQGSLKAWAKPFKGTILKMRPGGFPGGRDFRSYRSGARLQRNDTLFSYGGASGIGPTHWSSDGNPFQYNVVVRNEIIGMNAYNTVFVEYGWRVKIQRDFNTVVGRNF